MCRRNKEMFKSVKGFDYDHLMNAKSLIEFAERFSVIIYGYRSVEEYFYLGSSNNFVDNFRGSKLSIPLLCMNSYDDPLVPVRNLPFLIGAEGENDDAHLPDNILFLTTSTGGHLGWINGYDGSSWMHSVTTKYIKSLNTK
eukprot:TRINITY_DN903_c0_g1_i1.p1 TRINITY_DN903_c0_g1~~TRINITY_DN903_c0_g1_i1.p1  ORF type:complete len:141 (+),score=26.42 TRINITY_DN903_c0_g1_i1:342-764(+)